MLIIYAGLEFSVYRRLRRRKVAAPLSYVDATNRHFHSFRILIRERVAKSVFRVTVGPPMTKSVQRLQQTGTWNTHTNTHTHTHTHTQAHTHKHTPH